MQPTQPEWIATSATVTSCRFQSGALRAMSFGLPTPKFRITFDYYAHGRLYSDSFNSPKAIPQNETIDLSYNPLDPKENSRTHSPTASPGSRSPLLAVGIVGSVILSLAWLLVLRSCSP